METRFYSKLHVAIVTGGNDRWANAELHFTPVKWSDFGALDLEAALAVFAGRQRCFGGLVSDMAGGR